MSLCGYQGHWRGVVSHLVDGEYPTDYHLCLSGDEGGEDQTRTVAQHQTVADEEGLEVFGTARRGGYWHLGERGSREVKEWEVERDRREGGREGEREKERKVLTFFSR